MPALLAVGVHLFWKRKKEEGAERPETGALPLGLAVAALAWAGIGTLMIMAEDSTFRFRVVAYVLLVVGWAAVVGTAIAYRRRALGPGVSVAFVRGLAFLTFLICPPEHAGNGAILRKLITTLARPSGLLLPERLEAAATQVMGVTLISSPGIGAALWGAFIAGFREFRLPEIRWPLLLGTTYFAATLVVPLSQTFYLIPLLPILAILLADVTIRAWGRHSRLVAAAAVLAVCAGNSRARILIST